MISAEGSIPTPLVHQTICIAVANAIENDREKLLIDTQVAYRSSRYGDFGATPIDFNSVLRILAKTQRDRQFADVEICRIVVSDRRRIGVDHWRARIGRIQAEIPNARLVIPGDDLDVAIDGVTVPTCRDDSKR